MIETIMLYTDFDNKRKAETIIEDKHSLYKEMIRLKNKFQTKEFHYGVILEQENQSLCIGFCEVEWLLIVTIGPDVQAQYRSKGDLNRDNISEYYWMEWNGVSDKSLIPKEQAWEAVKYWLDTGKLSPDIEWSDRLLG